LINLRWVLTKGIEKFENFLLLFCRATPVRASMGSIK
jgi:hypothetical protein